MISDSLTLVAAARRSAERAWRDGYAYIKPGILLDHRIAADLRPRTLLMATPNSAAEETLLSLGADWIDADAEPASHDRVDADPTPARVAHRAR